MKKTLLLVAALVILAAPVMAFHDGGVAHCNGCHTMHNSQDGQLVDPDSPNGNPWLLVDATPSDVCLNCHATGLGAVFADDPMNPAPLKGGGNFIFLLEDNLNDGHGGSTIGDMCDTGDWDTQIDCEDNGGTWLIGVLTHAIPGDAAGHNLNAPGHGLAADATLATAPGGTFPGALMACSSCHDPHGTSTFRMLYGENRSIHGGFFTFTEPAPEAAGLSIFFGTATDENHTAYQSGMSAWCANCHGDFHDATNSLLKHPAGVPMGATRAIMYSFYDGSVIDPTSGLITPGDPNTSYLEQVPFEDAAMTTAYTGGPNAASQVSCVTCHRAHGSSAPDAGRWDFSITFMEEDGAESGSWPIPPAYTGDGVEQRSMCNKCHYQDAYDLQVPE